MLKSLTVISLVVTALAQSSIPTGISSQCSTFLTALNTDSDLAKCSAALSGALSGFPPAANGTASASTVNSTLTNLCSDSTTSSCSSQTLAAKISYFSANCTAELTTNPVDAVLKIYDMVYVLFPFKQAICSKDDSGSWCVNNAQTPDGTSAQAMKDALYTEDGGNMVPNTDTFNTYNIPFILLEPTSSNLCTPCTRNILTSYINWGSNTPYGPPLSKSVLLSGQSALFNAVQDQCGSSFMEGEVKAAGGLSSSNILGTSSGAVPAAEFRSFVAAFTGFATLAVAALL